MFSAIADGFRYLYDLLIRLGTYILNGIWRLFSPLFEFIGAIFYFLYMLGVVLVKIVAVVLALGKMLVGIVTGLFLTITGLNYTGAPATLPNSYSSVFGKLAPILGNLQMDKVAYLLSFGIWITAAFYAVKIIGEMRGNGGGD